MRRILQNKLLTIVIVLSIVFFVFIGFTASKTDRVNVFEGVVGNVLTPVQKYLYMGGQRVGNFFGFIGDISTIKNENEELKKKNSELEQKLIDYDEVVSQNDRLKSMLDFKDSNKVYDYYGANIVGKGSDNWNDTFIIDKGSNHGIKKYYPVVNSNGLIGQVVEVGPNWSKVLSMVDERSWVSGEVSRTRDQGMIQGYSGSSGERKCKMLYLPADSKVEKGDIVATSGISKFFPKGVKVGVVEDIESDNGDFTKTLIIKPEVDFNKLEEVFVITNSMKDTDYPDEGN